MKKKIMKRTKIMDNHKDILLSFFQKVNKFPDKVQVQELQKQTNLSSRTIKVWFQNKRQRRDYPHEDLDKQETKKSRQEASITFHPNIPNTLPNTHEQATNTENHFVVNLADVQKVLQFQQYEEIMQEVNTQVLALGTYLMIIWGVSQDTANLYATIILSSMTAPQCRVIYEIVSVYLNFFYMTNSMAYANTYCCSDLLH